MVSFTYNIGCRNCLKGDGVRRMYSLRDFDREDFQPKAESGAMTEFEAMMLVEDWRAEGGENTCLFCGSSNVEVYDVGLGDFRFYDYSRLIKRCKEKGEFILELNIDKRNSELTMKPGGSPSFASTFLTPATIEIFKIIKERPDNLFKPHPNGNFYVCLTGGTDYFSGRNSLRVEKFRSAGLSKGEILDALKTFADSAGVTVEEDLLNE